MAKHLRCYLLRASVVDGDGARRVAHGCAMGHTQQEAEQLIVEHYMARGARSVVLADIGRVAIVAGGYLVREQRSSYEREE